MSARELFEKFDVNGSGSITCAEVQNVLRELGVAGDYAAMVRAVDGNNDGTIDWDEFQEMMKSSDGLGAVIKEKRASILNVRLGAANSQHTFSREETEAFTEVINARLARDGQLASVLPLGTGGADPPDPLRVALSSSEGCGVEAKESAASGPREESCGGH